MNPERVACLTVLWMALFVAHCEHWLLTLTYQGHITTRVIRTRLPQGHGVHLNGTVWRVAKVECAK